MIILGIDPGTTRIGFGIIKKDRGTLSCIRYGLIAKPPSDKFLAARHVVNELTKLIAE